MQQQCWQHHVRGKKKMYGTVSLSLRTGEMLAGVSLVKARHYMLGRAGSLFERLCCKLCCH